MLPQRFRKGIRMTEGCNYCCLISLMLSKRPSNSVAETRFRRWKLEKRWWVCQLLCSQQVLVFEDRSLQVNNPLGPQGNLQHPPHLQVHLGRAQDHHIVILWNYTRVTLVHKIMIRWRMGFFFSSNCTWLQVRHFQLRVVISLWKSMQTENMNGPRRDPWGKPHTEHLSLSSESGGVLKDTRAHHWHLHACFISYLQSRMGVEFIEEIHEQIYL